MNFKLIAFCIFFTLLSFILFPAQAQNGNASYFQPTIFPSAPNTAAFAKFGSYPVSAYSGVPDITIPLYTIEAGGLQVPITLSYHASGIKIADAASWVGLGWSVSAGGSITRKIMGIPDEKGFFNETKRNYNLRVNNDLDYVQRSVEYREHDNMPDMYSYSFPGHSGKFFFDADSGFNIMTVPRAPLKITGTYKYHTYTNCDCLNQRFGITDEHGNLFLLGAYKESTSTDFYSGTNTSAWMLDTMISQNKRDTVSFVYKSHQFQLPDDLSETITVEDAVQLIDQKGQGYNAANPSTVISDNAPTVNEQQLQTIYFKNGKVEFILGTTGRQDIGNTGFAGSTVYPLDTIKISTYNYALKRYEVQKSIVFNKSYFGTTANGNNRLRLDGIQMLDKAGSIIEHYGFSYNTSVTLPQYASYAKDYWGYYNGKDASRDLIPQTSIQMINTGGGLYNMYIGNTNDPNAACRDIDTTKMQANILTSIKYPTGGRTDFVYETNRYHDPSHQVHLAGGLRIKTISSYSDSTATPIVKSYQYDKDSVNFIVDANYNLNPGIFFNTQTYRDWAYTQDPGNPETITGTQLVAQKRVRRYYAQPNEDLDLDGVPVAYTQVSEYTGTPAANTGKTVYNYGNFRKSSLEGGGGETGLPLIYDFSFSNNELTAKTNYLRKTDGSYQPVMSESNTYGAWPGYYYDNVGIAMGQRIYNDGVLAGNPAYYLQESPDDENSYVFGDYAIQAGDTYLTSKTTTVFDQNDPTKTTSSTVSYHYNDTTFRQLTSTVHYDSKGNKHISYNKYAFNYLSGHTTNNAVLDSMVSRHIWADPVEQWDSVKNASTGLNAVTAGQLNQYKFGSLPGSIMPSKISTLSVASPLTNFTPATITSGSLTGDSRYVQMISFDTYDLQNNITHYTPRNSTPSIIMWDYLNQMPVAQIKNAPVSTTGGDLAYTSFEADGKGNWLYSGKPVSDLTAPTGFNVYPLSSGSVSINFYNSNKSDIVSYWSNAGVATVTCGTTNLIGTMLASANGWTYYEHTIPQSSASAITISGSVSIDELRLYPIDAQMTTYSYSPAGLTEVADSKGSINQFEYDAFNRFKNTKDWLGNIVKSYGYHTYDQTIGNDAISKSVTRNNCPKGYTAGSLTYNVPLNKYLSSTKGSANAEASYEVNTVGQSKANAYCGCTVVTTGFTLTNSTGIAGFTASFSGGSNPSFNFPASGSAVVQVPVGNYTSVYIGPVGSNSHTFTFQSQTMSNVHSATFSVGTVASGSNLTLSIQ